MPSPSQGHFYGNHHHHHPQPVLLPGMGTQIFLLFVLSPQMKLMNASMIPMSPDGRAGDKFISFELTKFSQVPLRW